MKGLYDWDFVVYTVGSACDGRHYMYKGQRWESKKELNEVLREDGVDPSSIEIQKDPEPWEKCRTSVVKYVEDMVDNSGHDEYQGFISGSGNFRYDIATILPYKGNRSGLEKPFHYDTIRQFLVDVYDAEVSSGMEADDVIGLSHDLEEGSTFIASLDKDLDCIPGMHYNWDKDKWYEVSEIEAYRNFYKQLLTGDNADNIPGLYNVGPKSVLLKKIDKMDTEEEMYTHCFLEYEKRFGSYASQFMKENARLLWILQNRKNMFME